MREYYKAKYSARAEGIICSLTIAGVIIASTLIVLFIREFIKHPPTSFQPRYVTIEKGYMGWDNGKDMRCYKLMATGDRSAHPEVAHIITSNGGAIFTAGWDGVYFDVVDSTKVEAIRKQVEKWVKSEIRKEKP
jgi:hypothetical protein